MMNFPEWFEPYFAQWHTLEAEWQQLQPLYAQLRDRRRELHRQRCCLGRLHYCGWAEDHPEWEQGSTHLQVSAIHQAYVTVNRDYQQVNKIVDHLLTQQAQIQRQVWEIDRQQELVHHRSQAQQARKPKLTPDEKVAKLTTKFKRLQAKLVRVEQKLAENAVQSNRYSGHNTNPANDIGGIRSRSKRQKERLWNKWDQLAHDCVLLSVERASLIVDIADLEMKMRRLLGESS